MATPIECINLALASFVSGRPVWFEAGPGVGKSAIVHRAAAIIGGEEPPPGVSAALVDRCRLLIQGKTWVGVIDLRAALLSAVDLRGLPKVEAGITAWFPPGFLPHDPETAGILLLDELPQGVMAVQNAMMQLVYDRRSGEYSLPPCWRIMAASNRVKDQAGVSRMNAGLRKRFWTVAFEPDLEQWQAWASIEGVSPEIRAFLRWKPQALYEDAVEIGPNPRSWAFASDLFQVLPAELRHEALSGAIGQAAAAEFLTYIAVFRNLPTVDEIKADPKGCKRPDPQTEIGAVYGVVSLLAEAIRKSPDDQSLAEAALIYGARLPDEYGLFLIRDIAAVNPGILLGVEGEAAEWFERHRQTVLDVLSDDGPRGLRV
jgi:hypothetical protein